MSDYEPPAEMVEALQEEFECVSQYGLSRVVCAHILRRQHEREQPMRDAMERAVQHIIASVRLPGWHDSSLEADRVLREALAAHAKLAAPKVPTLAEAVEQIERECPGRVIATLKDSQAWVIIKQAAVEREERGA